jgi:uncharacterized protein
MSKAPLGNWRNSPTLVRVVPFLIFVGLTACQGAFGEQSRYWFYVLKTVVGVALVWATWPWVPEMRWRASPAAVIVGLAVFVIWVVLDGLYPSLDAAAKKLLCPVLTRVGFESWCSAPISTPTPWNPFSQFDTPLAWVIFLTRLLGSALVVPPLEEVFYRSFLYRYIARPEFDTLPLNFFRWAPFLMTAVIFGCAHYEWVPGIMCGILYQALVVRSNRLGDAMTAHAITNFLLGLWVLWKGAWHFW